MTCTRFKKARLLATTTCVYVLLLVAGTAIALEETHDLDPPSKHLNFDLDAINPPPTKENTKQEGGGLTTSPLLIIGGFGQPSDHYYLRPQILEASNPQPVPARSVDFAPTLIRHHENLKNEVGAQRLMALPDFQLNRTSVLRLALWFPCYKRPSQKISFSMAPCVFQRLSNEEYEKRTPPQALPGREVSLYLKDDTSGDYIHAVCWFPRDEVLDQSPMTWLNLAHRSYAIRIQHVFQQDPDSLDGESEICVIDAEGQRTDSKVPSVWYGFTTESTDPTEFSPGPPPPGHDTMCRSWIQIRRIFPPVPPQESETSDANNGSKRRKARKHRK